MSIQLIKFEKGNKKLTWYPEKKEQIFKIPLQKKIEVKSGKKIEVKKHDEIIIDKIVQRNDEYGQPYLPIKLIGEVIKNIENKPIFGMKYKAKKRTKKTWRHSAKFTLIKILKPVESK